MTKIQAIEIFMQCLDALPIINKEPKPLLVHPEQIFQALNIAIEALQTHPAPDWSDAPEWAQWYAIDPDIGDGAEGWFYEKEPFMLGDAAYTSAFAETLFVGRTVLKWKRPE